MNMPRVVSRSLCRNSGRQWTFLQEDWEAKWTVIEADCGLKINGLDVVPFMVIAQLGPFAFQEYRYVCLQEDTVSTPICGADATVRAECESVCAIAAESFKVG